MATPVIRELLASDQKNWTELWSDYLTFYKTSVSTKMFDLAFERLTSGDSGEFQGLIAELDNQPVGLAHTLTHRHGWYEEKVIYLQDLFVSPQARRNGIGRALVNEIYRRADTAGTPNVYWLTAADNLDARILYDQIAADTGFIKYQRQAPGG